MQVPVISGIYADTKADFRTSYPVNLVPVPKDTGISQGYLRTAEGIEQFNTGPLSGLDRGGIVWNGVLYRVFGSSLIRVHSSGSVDILGNIGAGSQCSFDYSFDRLAIASSNRLYYWKDRLTGVTDPDLGSVIDMIWIDGYFATTDGEYIVVTELNDPTAVNPLKYGSSESDPDPIVGLLKVRNELIALNRYSIEFFDNTGGENFPFQRIEGALIPKGCVGTHAKCKIAQTFAFVGSGRNEPCSVYIGGSGTAQKVATREIEILLNRFSESELSKIIVEAREYDLHQHLYIHLPDMTLVYDIAGTAATGQPVWFILRSGVDGKQAYRAFNFTFAYNNWICGDKLAAQLGRLTNDTFAQYGDPTFWQFNTGLLYNNSKAAQVHSLELVATSRSDLGEKSSIYMSYTKDGVNWSQEHLCAQGQRGEYSKRIVWHRAVGMFRQFLSLRFRGAGTATIAIPRLEVEVEPLNV